MKFVCERCQTKYSIADEKVRQKVLKIRCKTCENVITIRDAVVVTEPAAPRAEPPPAPSAAGGAAARGSSIEWHLAVNGQQTGPFGVAALVTRILAAGKNDEVYVWNEHLDGWKEPKQVPEVAAELQVRAAASAPPSPPIRRAPSPAAGVPHGRAAAPTVRSGGRSSPAMAAVEFAPAGEEEKTQISALDASLMMAPDAASAPTRAQPSLKYLAQGAMARGAAVEKQSVPAPTNGHARKPSAATGLEALDFSTSLRTPSRPAIDVPPAALPVPAPAPAAAPGNGVPNPIVGGSTSMLLSQVGGRAAKPRHPALKFAVVGGLLVGLVGVIAAVSLGGGDKVAAPTDKPVAPETPTTAATDPEARARAEAEKYFKSMVGKAPPPAPSPSTKTVAPAAPPRRSQGRSGGNKATEPAPLALAPPPVSGTPTGPDPARVTQRFSQDERKVATPTKERSGKGNDDFDIQKFMAVFKQPDHYAAIKSCYERALKRDDNLRQARIDINVTVSDSGNARRVRVAAPPEFSSVSNCIEGSVRRWRFPGQGKEYEASFPLILQGKTD